MPKKSRPKSFKNLVERVKLGHITQEEKIVLDKAHYNFKVPGIEIKGDKSYYSSTFKIFGKSKEFVHRVKEKYYKQLLKVGDRGKSNGRSVNKILMDYVMLCEKKGLNPILRIPQTVNMPSGNHSAFPVFLTGNAAQLIITSQHYKKKKKIKLNKNELLHFFITDFIALSEEHKKNVLRENGLGVDLLINI